MQENITKVTENYAKKHDTGSFKSLTIPLYITGALAGFVFRAGASLVTRRPRSWEKFNGPNVDQIALGAATYATVGFIALAAGTSPLVLGMVIMGFASSVDSIGSSNPFLATKAGFRQIAGYNLG